MNIKLTSVLVLVMSVGVAIGWIIKPVPANDAGETEESGRYRAKRPAAESSIRVKTVTEVVTNVVREVVTDGAHGARVAGSPFRRGMHGFREELERLKTENPAEYAKHTNRMARFRSRMLDRAIDKLNILSSVDTTGWSDAQLETHERYQELITRREELIDASRLDGGEMSEQQRAEAWKEIGEISRQLRDVATKERDILLKKTFERLGYNRDETSELSGVIKEIFSSTQEGFGPRGRRR